ncbi:MAG: hypothetical protein HFF38_11025 [Lawsonibacter sp.]|nr:hypothetical protein [Lawsonibacter sp.]
MTTLWLKISFPFLKPNVFTDIVGKPSLPLVRPMVPLLGQGTVCLLNALAHDIAPKEKDSFVYHLLQRGDINKLFALLKNLLALLF